MLARLITMAFVAIAALNTGCAFTSATRVAADGSTTTTHSVAWVPSPVIAYDFDGYAGAGRGVGYYYHEAG